MKIREVIKEAEVMEPVKTPVTTPAETPAKKPGGFTLMILNDDYTPFEVVLEAIISAVGLSPEEAYKRMTQAHRGGWAAIKSYSSKDMAETVAHNVMRHAQQNNRYDHYRQDPHFRNMKGPWPLTAEVVEAGDGD